MNERVKFSNRCSTELCIDRDIYQAFLKALSARKLTANTDMFALRQYNHPSF